MRQCVTLELVPSALKFTKHSSQSTSRFNISQSENFGEAMDFFLKVVVSFMLVRKLECGMGQSSQSDVYTSGTSGSKVVDDVVKKVEGTLGDTNELLKRTAFVESKFGKDPSTYRKGYHGGIWQVDQKGFDDTQKVSSNPNLKNQYTKIKKEFGIDSPIPPLLQLESQADYWKRNYNRKRGKGRAVGILFRVLSHAWRCGLGKKLFTQKGRQFHTVEERGEHMTGPNLFGVCGRPAGMSPGYSYTDAMMHSGITWNVNTLDQFLQNPKMMVPGTAMNFGGLEKKDSQILAYFLCHCN